VCVFYASSCYVTFSVQIFYSHFLLLLQYVRSSYTHCKGVGKRVAMEDTTRDLRIPSASRLLTVYKGCN